MNELTPIEQSQLNHAPIQAIDPMVRMIEAVVQNPDLPIERLEKLMDMKERQEDRELEGQNRLAKQAYFSAMAQCQEEMPRVGKNQSNTHTKSNYADLGAVIATAQPVMARHGFSLSFHPGGVREGSLIMKWAVSHAAGHQETGEAGYPIDDAGVNGTKNKTGVQALASTETYARRYLILSLFNIATTDDRDGNEAPKKLETISAEQLQELRGLIDLAGISEDVLCKSAKIETLHELPADTFESAAKKLRITIENKAKLLEET